MASGALLLAKSVLDVVVGDPPSTGAQLVQWRSGHHIPLALTNEVLCFAVVLLIPAVTALYRRLDGPENRAVGFGCGVLATVIPITLVLVIIQGRLAYPVFGIDLGSPSMVGLLVSLYYGGAHLVSLLLASATIVLGLVMKRERHTRVIGVLGIVTGVTEILSSFPWIFGSAVAAVAQAFLAAWFFLIGLTFMYFPRVSRCV